MTVFRGDFNRKDEWAECDGVRYTSPAGGENIFPLCRLLFEAGHADGSVDMYDERGMHCLTINTIHGAAKKLINAENRAANPQVAQAALGPMTSTIYNFLVAISDGEWNNLHGRTRGAMVRNGYTGLDGVFTEKAVHDMAAFAAEHAPKAEPNTDPKIVTPQQALALRLIQAGKIVEFRNLNGKTKNCVVRYGWVKLVDERPVLTEIGQQVFAKEA